MRSELVIRRSNHGYFDVFDTSDPKFELNEISESQLLGYLKRQKLLELTPEGVLAQFHERRSVVHVAIER